MCLLFAILARARFFLFFLMVKISGPLHGDMATGVFARSVAFQKFRGGISAQKTGAPNGSKTPSQKLFRGRMRSAVAAWQVLPRWWREMWDAAAKSLQMSGYNLFIRHYLDDYVVGGYLSPKPDILPLGYLFADDFFYPDGPAPQWIDSTSRWRIKNYEYFYTELFPGIFNTYPRLFTADFYAYPHNFIEVSLSVKWMGYSDFIMHIYDNDLGRYYQLRHYPEVNMLHLVGFGSWGGGSNPDVDAGLVYGRWYRLAFRILIPSARLEAYVDGRLVAWGNLQFPLVGVRFKAMLYGVISDMYVDDYIVRSE